MAGKLLTNKTQAPVAKVLSCPNCGGQVEVRVPGKSLAATCKSCLSVVDTANESATVLAKQNKADAYEPVLPIGKRAKFRGEKWEVIGFIRKCDETRVYHWHEYLLFNPFQGFRWLVENQGHWNYFVPLKNRPQKVEPYCTLNGKRYRVYLRGGSEVEFVLGEFYWRVKKGDKAFVSDYINPPEMLSSEKTKTETNWTLGEYVEPHVVRDSFEVKGFFPAASGVAPNQPAPMAKAKGIYKVAFMLLGIMFVCQVLSSVASSGKSVLTEDKSWEPKAPQASHEFLSEPFVLEGSAGNVESRITSNVDNSWLELEMSLVNENTGESFDFRQLNEYYYGYTGGENWSEGSRSDEFVVPEVPGGTYRLRVDSAADKPTKFSVDLKRDTPVWSNFFMCALALWAIPGLVGIFHYMFEVSRWRDSDHAPAYIARSSEE